MKIFVSSTSKDLMDYRDKARKAIEESGNEFVGMEIFQSHTDEPSEFCPDKIEECRAFILIVAYRYGFIPEGKNISITHSEYEYAISKKIPLRIYVMSDEHPWPPKFLDENLEQIKRFRSLLLKKHTCSLFTTPATLYEKLKLDIKQFPNPPYFSHPYALQENFTGRVQERTMLMDWLKKDHYPVLAVIAIGGMGKTALSWYWLNEDVIGSDNQPKKVLWWSFYDEELGFVRFLKKAIEYFGEGNVDWKKLESARDQIDFLIDIFRNNRYLLILDGVERILRAHYNIGSPYQSDGIDKDEKEDFRSCIEPNCGLFFQWLASGNPKTKTLLTSRLYPRELDGLDGCLRKDLKEMDKEDAFEFFQRQGVRVVIRAELEEIFQNYGCHPLSLRLLSSMIVHDMKYNGDIKAWRRYNPVLAQHVLELAYESLDRKKQEFISKISAFRNPVDYNAVMIFNDFGDEGTLNERLIELVDRGLLFRNEKSNKFGMHPVVRKYCYDRLHDKESVHSRLKDYLAVIPVPEKIDSMEDLVPVIELYYHTVRAGKYDEAVRLYVDRIVKKLYYRFGAYQIMIDLLRFLFPDGEDKPPKLKDESAQSWAMNYLANSYALSGQPRRAAFLYEMADRNSEKRNDKKNAAINLGNLAYMAQIPIGEFDLAEFNLRRSIEISNEIKDDIRGAICLKELGLLLIYLGKFDEAEDEIKKALDIFEKLNEAHFQSIGWAYRSLRAFLTSDAEEAIKYGGKARALADIEKYERDIIQAEYLHGAAQLMKGDLAKAEKHLSEALIRDRKINLVEFEPDILLELAKLRFKQNRAADTLNFAHEALQIADRCEYRLKQADIHNFLTEFYLDAGNLAKAKEHGEMAKQRAECGYMPALENAKKLLKDIALKESLQE